MTVVTVLTVRELAVIGSRSAAIDSEAALATVDVQCREIYTD